MGASLGEPQYTNSAWSADTWKGDMLCIMYTYAMYNVYKDIYCIQR